MSDVSAHSRWPESPGNTAGHEAVRRSAPALNVPAATLTHLMVASDTLALAAALLLSYLVASSTPGLATLQPSAFALLAATVPAWLLAAGLSGLYGRNGRPGIYPATREWATHGQLIVIVTAALIIGALWARIDEPALSDLVVFAASAFALVTIGRVAARTLARRRGGYVQSAVIVGAGEVGQLVARKLLRHPEYGINPVGFVDAPPDHLRPDVAKVPVVGTVDDLGSIVRRLSVDRVIVAFSSENDHETLERVRPLAGLNVNVDVVPRMFELIGPKTGLPNIEGIPLISISPRTRSATALRVKRAIDVVGASIGLILAAPLFLWAAWRIPRESLGPVFFRQTRLGEDMREFTMLKFRTMTADADQSSHHAYVERAMSGEETAGDGELYKLDRRDVITPTGRWLRRTSLDELPQLLNVLQGTMSLVGPRPCLAYETEYFAPHHYERFLAPPGITGLWQVTARAHASFPEALDMDVMYVRDWSLGLDLSLLVRTPAEALRQRKATV